MKKIVFILGALIGLMAVGCDNKECDTCYAASGATVSWTDYNSVSDLHEFFNGHDSTLMQHVGDTIRFCGWVYYPDIESGEPTYAVMIPDWTVEVGTMFLVDNEDHHFHGNYGSAYVTWPRKGQYMTHEDSVWYENHVSFVEQFEELLPKKWYVTARIEYVHDLGLGCCGNYAPRYRINELDTINK